MENGYQNKKLKVAILGSGNIGTDLLLKINKSSYLSCTYLVGRNESSKGLAIAKALGISTSSHGIETLIENSNAYELVFDATSAEAHLKHAIVFKDLQKKVIDLTPAKIGKSCVPSINIAEAIKYQNINMVTCGGQASIPLVFALSKLAKVEYAEIVTSIASSSAGAATRENINEYICSTEKTLQEICNCGDSKVILNLNPAIPEVDMKTTIYAKIDIKNEKKAAEFILQMVKKIKLYVPGYEILIPSTLRSNIFNCMIRVKGCGDYLPNYAGNLDIITCAAIYTAEEIAKTAMIT